MVANRTYELLVNAGMRKICMKVYNTRVEISSEVSRGVTGRKRGRDVSTHVI